VLEGETSVKKLGGDAAPDNRQPVFSFGKVDKDTFNLDFRHPMSVF
jgi:hypothetical protein